MHIKISSLPLFLNYFGVKEKITTLVSSACKYSSFLKVFNRGFMTFLFPHYSVFRKWLISSYYRFQQFLVWPGQLTTSWVNLPGLGVLNSLFCCNYVYLVYQTVLHLNRVSFSPKKMFCPWSQFFIHSELRKWFCYQEPRFPNYDMK